MFGLKEAVMIIAIVIRLITSIGLSVESIEVEGYNQEIYTVKARLPEANVEQRLSYDEIYGFETLVDMAKPVEIGYNGMFYNDIGRPAGILIMDGQLIKKQSIGTPLFIIRKDGSCELIEPELSTFIVHEGTRYESFELNEGMTDTLLAVFTSWYGPHNRRRYDHTTYFIEDGTVVGEKLGEGSDLIPETYVNPLDGNFMLSYQTLRYDLPIQVGDSVTYVVESNFDIDTVDEAFQTGGWLIRDGENVTRDFEGYVGPTTSLQPRTAIGITEEGQVILKVVDGRNPGVSQGVTGYQLAELLLEDGCVQAAFLDGGASSTVVVDKELINRPSLGTVKSVAHGLFLRRNVMK